MRCKNCGNNFQDGLLQCPACGTKVDQQQAQYSDEYSGQNNTNGYQEQQGNPNWNNQGGQYGNPYGGSAGGGMNWNNHNNFQQNVGNAPDFVLFLVIGIVYCLCCCNIIVGVPALIFTIMMNNAYKEGRQADYLSNKRVAKWIYIGGIILWVISVVLGFVFNVFGAIATSVGGY